MRTISDTPVKFYNRYLVLFIIYLFNSIPRKYFKKVITIKRVKSETSLLFSLRYIGDLGIVIDTVTRTFSFSFIVYESTYTFYKYVKNKETVSIIYISNV